MRVLVTGANGFVSHVLLPVLAAGGHSLLATVHRPDPTLADGVVVGDIDERTDWLRALVGVDSIVHLAARVHVTRETAANPLAAFRRVNVAGTERLARQAAQAGVKRLVFLSSIKVNGEQTRAAPYREEDVPAPGNLYGVSKWEAEQALRRLAQDTGLEVVILRPPLVYGPGVKANFLRLMDLTARGWPLPFGSVNNCRSFIFVGNLVGAIVRCLDHPAAKGETFLVSDGEDVSTPELIRRLASALGRRARLVPLPPALLTLTARALGKTDEVNRLASSLQVDSSRIRQTLGWISPYSMEEGLKATADWYRGLTGR